MGGSGLSVQAVKTIFGENEGVRIYSLRTTDPAVIKDILDQIAGHEGGSLDKALEKTLIIPISNQVRPSRLKRIRNISRSFFLTGKWISPNICGS
jgi:hypothetical protein